MKITIVLTGPDADKALAELISAIQYDKLRVKILVNKAEVN